MSASSQAPVKTMVTAETRLVRSLTTSWKAA